MRLALITGAHGGIGRELAALLKEQKIPCVLKGKKDGDLSTIVGRESLLEEIRKNSYDLVINNAGFGVYGEAVFGNLEEQREMLYVNLQALMEITLTAARTMIEKKQKGMIVNISSVGGQLPTPGMAVYGATKAFVTSFSKALDFECAPYGVRVLTTLPGMVKTPFAEKAAKKRVTENKRAIDPQFVAKEILWQIRRGKGVHVIDGRYRLMLFFVKYFFLERFAMKAIYNSIRKRL